MKNLIWGGVHLLSINKCTSSKNRREGRYLVSYPLGGVYEKN